SGQVLEWDLASDNSKQRERFHLADGIAFYRVLVSPDRQWLAGAAKNNRVVLRSLDGRQTKEIVLPEREYARSLAFAPQGERLAVGIGAVSKRTPFYVEREDRIAIYDLRSDQPKGTPGPKPSYHAECLAFHPNGKWLAIAGGSNHEVTVTDLARPEKPLG